MEPDGPAPERKIELDQPEPVFDPSIKESLLTKYPAALGILAANPKISARELGKQIGIGHDTANKIKREWEQQTRPTTSEESKVNFFGKGKTLSKEEVSEYSDSLPAALEDYFQAIDDWLWKRQIAAGKDSNEQPVWTNFDEKELARLTKFALKHGQRSALGAMAVRGVVESSDFVAVGSMFSDRFLETVKIYRETKRPRGGRNYATPD